MEDTLRVGNRLNDRGLVEVFAREGGMRVLELKRFGVEMRVRRGGISVGDTPGLMGLGMTKPMVEHLRREGVRIRENIVVTKLVKSGDAVVGARVRCEEWGALRFLFQGGGPGHGGCRCPLRADR